MRYDLFLIVLALLLTLAMLLTLYFGKQSSRHGYGNVPLQHSEVKVVLINQILY